MKTKTWLTLLLFSAALLFAPQVLAQTANWNLEQDTTQGNDDDGFGSKVAGAWLGEASFGLDFDCDGVADTPAGPAATDIQSFSAGGLYVAVNPANPNSGLGTWEKTGSRQISAQDIVFFPMKVDPADPTGPVRTEVQFIARIKVVVNFERGFETATSNFWATLYYPDKDPLDPNFVVGPPDQGGDVAICTAGQHTSLRKVNPTP